jgi:hypothetical protein
MPAQGRLLLPWRIDTSFSDQIFFEDFCAALAHFYPETEKAPRCFRGRLSNPDAE